MLELAVVGKSYDGLRQAMSRHYSMPRGFVGRSICYQVQYSGICYGYIAGGSCTRFLPGRNEFIDAMVRGGIVNNIFFHIEKVEGMYPVRNFAQSVVKEWREMVSEDWKKKYGYDVEGFETLVELPRTGDVYIRDGWTEVGITKGNTCKRVAGQGSDSWTGRRVWDTVNLRPKRVFCRKV